MTRDAAATLASRATPRLGMPPPESTDEMVEPHGLRRFVLAHLGSREVSRVIYGAIIGLALIVALETHPPEPGVVAASLAGTAVAVALAELYSELIGLETRDRRRPTRAAAHHLRAESAAVASGIAFPAGFFVLAAVDVLDEDAAFTLAKWTGLALIGFYGFAAARLAGAKLSTALLQATAVALIGAFLIALKALIH